MIAYLFPGQGSQTTGMGKDLYENYEKARKLFKQANEILGFDISQVMFEGTDEDLRQTKVTQPAVFIQSIISFFVNGEKFLCDYVAGHSLGEFTALVANGTLSFEDGLRLVGARANAMQKACEAVEGTMAAVMGFDDDKTEEICADINEIVAPANYNCPGQLVISGSKRGIEKAITKLKEHGAKRAIELQVGGAFHSPLMKPAEDELAIAIMNTEFRNPKVPIFQNVNAMPQTNPDNIRNNLILQLTSPVKWTQIIENMKLAGVTKYIEVGGNGKTLTSFVKKVDKDLEIDAI